MFTLSLSLTLAICHLFAQSVFNLGFYDRFHEINLSSRLLQFSDGPIM